MNNSSINSNVYMSIATKAVSALAGNLEIKGSRAPACVQRPSSTSQINKNGVSPQKVRLMTGGTDKVNISEHDRKMIKKQASSFIVDLHKNNNEQIIAIDTSEGLTTPSHPVQVAESRKSQWPDFLPMARDVVGKDMSLLYSTVKRTGLPNCLSARIPLKNSLNIKEWRSRLPNTPEGDQLVDFLTYGFPMSYQGPPSDQPNIKNHTSAWQFQQEVDDFIKMEHEIGSLLGPFDSLPFDTWNHVSPMLTREKSEVGKRRIITDLSYGKSVNDHIVKGNILGTLQPHTLPTVDEVASLVVSCGGTAYLATVDIKRAYTNFQSDVLDWPLLLITWRNKIYLDITMPFGSRISSVHMQRIANSLVAMLQQQGHTVIIYLDDLLIIGRDRLTAKKGFEAALRLLEVLGLPVAKNKISPPATVTRWLGILIDSKNCRLVMPKDKIDNTLEMLERRIRQKALTKYQLRSLLGKLHHVARCVKPARLFVARLLDGLRAMAPDRQFTTIGEEMRKDIRWFLVFLRDFNGVSLMKLDDFVCVIEADASLQGVGAWGSGRYYASVLPKCLDHLPIAQIEALNVSLAVRTFIDVRHSGRTVLLRSDNGATVAVLQSGRGKDPTILQAARDIWMHLARYDVNLVVQHIPGVELILADALSRMTISDNYVRLASDLVRENSLESVEVLPGDLLLSYDM